MIDEPNIAPLVTFQATCDPLATAAQTSKANAAAPKCEPTMCVIVFAISSPLVCFLVGFLVILKTL